jgi:hypothetical protein
VSEAAPRRVWISFRHAGGSSSFILEVNASGAALLRYVQFGTIHTVGYWPTPAGGVLAAGGVIAEHRRPSLVLLPENDAPATSPADDPRRVTCAECPAGQPGRLFLFAPSELTNAAHHLYAYVKNIMLSGPNLRITAFQGNGDSEYLVSPNFAISSFQYTGSYWGAHKQLELQGRLDHTAEECPEQTAPVEVREWTPALGWRQQMVMPRPPPTSLDGTHTTSSLSLPAPHVAASASE